MGCDKSFPKNIVYFFNVFIALLGLMSIAFGIAGQLNWTDWHSWVMTIAPWVFIVVGIVMVIITSFGCCGAIRESHCLLVTYSIYLLVISIVHVLIAAILLVLDETFRTGMLERVHGLYKLRNSADVDQSTIAIIDTIQEEFKCCGDKGPEDYGVNATLPLSCCARVTSSVMWEFAESCILVDAYPGCTALLTNMYDTWDNKPIAGLTIGIACFEIIGAVFTLYLANSIRTMDRRFLDTYLSTCILLFIILIIKYFHI